MKDKAHQAIDYLKVTPFFSLDKGWLSLIQKFWNESIDDEDENSKDSMIVERDGIIALDTSILWSKLIKSPAYSPKVKMIHMCLMIFNYTKKQCIR